jgi:hypothetical protein
MCTRVTKKRALKTQSQDVIMKYSSQSEFVFQQAIFLSQNFSQSMSAQFMQSMTTQQFQNFQQSIVLDLTESQILQNSASNVSLFTSSSAEKILSVSADSKNDKHTQFLNTMIEMNKVFKIPCFVIKSDEEIVALNKQYTKADQESDMNVVSMNLARRLELQLRDLAEMRFRELCMKTANNHDIILYH